MKDIVKKAKEVVELLSNVDKTLVPVVVELMGEVTNDVEAGLALPEMTVGDEDINGIFEIDYIGVEIATKSKKQSLVLRCICNGDEYDFMTDLTPKDRVEIVKAILDTYKLDK
jgi:hypothetical protein